ncbi:MAG: hypothetical protein ABIL13_02075 [candidate division WOR-3 bacterium]
MGRDVLNDWDDLCNNLPLASLGVYFGEIKNQTFDYLIIRDMKYDPENPKLEFWYEYVGTSRVSSGELLKKLKLVDEGSKKLISSMESENLLDILGELGENPPDVWLNLVGNIQKRNWRDYIGKYFLDLESLKGENYEKFEDGVYELLRALGFDVEKKGKEVEGDFPDGIATYEEKEHKSKSFAIIYDCKNRLFYPNKDDERALENYYNKEKVALKVKNVFAVFIVKSCQPNYNGQFPCFPIESLLYLLYKKLELGNKFNLLHLLKFLMFDAKKDKVLKIEWIKKNIR